MTKERLAVVAEGVALERLVDTLLADSANSADSANLRKQP